MSSHRFDTDKLFPEAVPGVGEGLATKPIDSISIFILPDINGRGTMQIDTLIYSGVEFTSIKGQVKIEDRKIECYEVTGNAYTGTIAGKTTIDLTNFEEPVYTGEFAGNQIEMDDFVSRFTKLGGHIFGKGDVTGSYTARGWEPEAFLNSLSMSARTNVREGRVVTSGATYSLLSGLAEKTGQTFAKEQPFKDLNTNIIVKDGRVSTDGLKTRFGAVGDLELQGSYGFDESVDYSGTLLLTKEMTQKLVSQGDLLGGLAGLLSNKSSERLSLPLKITGSLHSPKVDLDYSAITSQLGEGLQDKAGDLLKGLLKKKP